MAVLKEEVSEVELDVLYPHLELGGSYRPEECRAKHRVAIIVPYRDRKEHLHIFLNNMHRILIRQQIDYTIFIVEQEGLYTL